VLHCVFLSDVEHVTVVSDLFVLVVATLFLLVPAHPGCPGQFPQSRKTVVCVCV